RGATGRVERAVIALPGLSGVGVIAAPPLIRARRASALVRVGPARGRADRAARGRVPRARARVDGIAPLPIHVGTGRAAAGIAIVRWCVVEHRTPRVNQRGGRESEAKPIGPPDRGVIDWLRLHPVGHWRRIPRCRSTAGRYSPCHTRPRRPPPPPSP